MIIRIRVINFKTNISARSFKKRTIDLIESGVSIIYLIVFMQ